MSFSVPWRWFSNAESAAANLVTMNPWLPLLSLLLVFLQASQSLELPLWPWPQFVEFGEGPPTALSDTFHIQAPPNSILQLAAARYKDLILKERWLPLAKPSSRSRKRSSTSSGVRELQFLRISVTDLDVELQHGVDESYSIHVPELDRVEHLGLSAVLSAETVWGALRGLETFSQLVVRVREGNSKLFVPHTVDIVDEPLFPHRGLLLDTSRNFYPVDAILRTVRAMAHNKMNVFHWHITDSHSFPLRLSKEPELADLGAYGFRETYSREDVAMIVEFGRVRGVRVIPELDMPGEFPVFFFNVELRTM